MYNIADGNIFYYGKELEDGVLEQARNHYKDERCKFVRLMGDNHLGYSTMIGGVVAYEDAISPSAVGFDISCGCKSVKTNLFYDDVKRDLETFAELMWSEISFGVGRKNAEEVDHELFDDNSWNEDRILEISKEVKGNKNSHALKNLAREQLGTVGAGNHFVLCQKDTDGRVWISCHFGSRGLGHKIATYFIKIGGGRDDIMAIPTLLSTNSDVGRSYISAMKLAGRYAYAGRDWVCNKVASIFGATILEEVHMHHNFAWEEEHFGQKLWVHRKGATPCFVGQKYFVGSSMGEPSIILEAKECQELKDMLNSTVHGAGRVMGRMEAKGKTKKNKETGEYEVVREGKVTEKMMMDWVNSKGVILKGAGVDESPHCYKRLDEVLEFHKETTNIVHRLTPLIVCMAGKEFDPYKD